MKKTKKLLALLMAVLMVVTLIAAVPAAQAADVSEQTAQQVVSALGIMVGDGSGNMMLDSTLTRSQMAKILVKLSSGNITLSASTSPFPDVPFTNWAAPYVSKAVSLGFINGCPDGTFKPDQSATTEEFAKTLLAVLGYTSADYGVGWPWAQVNYATKLGLFDGVSPQVGSPVTRRDVMYMIYNTLNATAKSGKIYAAVLGYATMASGDLDVGSIINSNSTGPVTVKDTSWYAGTGLNTSTAAVYLNDKPSTFAAIQPNTIVYYSVNMNTIWAYDKKISGILQNVLPSRLSPTSVVVSGTTYTLSGTAASTAASYIGPFNYGDAVTLLFDRNGSVADIVPADASTTVTGYVSASGSKVYTNADGSTYNSYYITLITVDGSKSEYQLSWNPSSSVGQVVTVGFSNGSAQLVSAGSSTVSGIASYDGMTIGSQKMSPDIRILDVDSYGNYASIFPQRIDGVYLSSSNVISCQTDSSGAVTSLFLNNVTGDTSTYGLLTNVDNDQKHSTMTNFYGVYTYNIAGTTGSLKTSGTQFNVTNGPAAFTYQNGAIVNIKNLTSIGSVTLSGGDAVVTSSGTRYLLSGNVQYFQQASDGSYALITASKAAGMSLTAYNDKAENAGGRVRVIIAS